MRIRQLTQLPIHSDIPHIRVESGHSSKYHPQDLHSLTIKHRCQEAKTDTYLCDGVLHEIN